MYSNDKNNAVRSLRYKVELEKYNEAVRNGEGTYKQFKRLINMHLNLTIRSVKGLERDHIVPASFCRKLGLTISQTNHIKNIQYITPEQNMEKWSFIGEKEREHLARMLPIWEIEMPSNGMIAAHNKIAEESNLHKSLMKKAGKKRKVKLKKRKK